MYEPRLYRSWYDDNDLVSFNVVVDETDLFICADKVLEKEAKRSVEIYRAEVEDFIKKHREFLLSLKPVNYEGNACPQIVCDMIDKSAAVGVGPMATVAGAIAEFVGKDLLCYSSEIIVENGGDIFLKSNKKRIIGLFSGKDSAFSKKVGLEIEAEDTPIGICTSSGTVGHSMSFGKSDAVVVVSQSTPLADAAATMIGNHIVGEEDIEKGIRLAKRIEGLKGIVIVKNDKIGFWGEIKVTTTG